jgi:hypothetical protein
VIVVASMALVLFAMVAGCILQLVVFREVGGRLPIANHLWRFSILPVFAVLEFIAVPPLALCVGGPNLPSILGWALAIGMVLVLGFVLQFAVFFLTLENAVYLQRGQLAGESPAVKQRLLWYLKRFGGMPGSRMRREELDAVIRQLETR